MDNSESSIKKKSGVAGFATGCGRSLFNVLSGGLSFYTLAAAGLVLILVFIPCMLISAIPLGDLFQTEESLNTAGIKINDAVSAAYEEELNKSKKIIQRYVNTDCGCDASPGDIYVLGDTAVIDTDSCSITARFTPESKVLSENISAYINSVNASIAYFGEETNRELNSYYEGTHEKGDGFEGTVFDTDSEGNVSVTDEAQDFYKSHSDALTNSAGPDALNEIRDAVRTSLRISEESSWEKTGFHTEEKTCSEYRITGYDEKTGEPVYSLVDVTVFAQAGTIEIPVRADLSGYKKAELLMCVENIKKSQSEYISDAAKAVKAVLDGYIESFLSRFDLSSEMEGIIMTDLQRGN